ncbi:hypothetical protein TanjilG_31183 [Lupinus angustifolius]|uniref:Uncharacterized protein n=1 Tax=Lupinus angustifolius TaxID=3871 RepID=A0A394DE31_LUPAN|nr:PREDICTED: uncharacterized protein LOC109339604 [Lupinus angustifolius]OIW21253.1 hypothetical protein TanjilG_31183 [Lupinus angustifolius]
MATFSLISNSLSNSLTFLSPPPSSRAPPFPISPELHFSAADDSHRRKPRGAMVATRAGPSTSSLVFAFTLPLSLVAVTVFASIRIADKLDQKFLEEMAMNEAIMEVDEFDKDNDDDEDDDVETYLQEEPVFPHALNRPDVDTSLQEEPAVPRGRNRPKREA